MAMEIVGGKGGKMSAATSATFSESRLRPADSCDAPKLATLKRKIIESALACASEDSAWLRQLPQPPRHEAKVVIEQKRHRKRPKANRISFKDGVDIIVPTPYEEGRTDAETIQQYQAEIWYAVRCCLVCGIVGAYD
jgi:hypothetical protein